MMFFIVWLIFAAVPFNTGVGLRPGNCPDKMFKCQCGSVPNIQLDVRVEQCSFIYKGKIRCSPCDKLEESKVCQKYHACKHCNSDRCTECPIERSGQWCEKNCKCQNGGECDNNGLCQCVAGYEGRFCEIKRAAKCEDPGPLRDGYVDVDDGIDGFPVGTIITYRCSKHFEIEGYSTSVCSDNATWTINKPTCIKVRFCSDLPIPRHTSVKVKTPKRINGSSRRSGSTNKMANVTSVALPVGRYRLGTKIRYSCESVYYKVNGSRTRRCLWDGSWTGKAATCLSVCGRSNYPKSRLDINGQDNEIREWPWHVGLNQFFRKHLYKDLRCSGALISDSWVLTAANCVTDINGKRLSLEDLKFKFGKYYRDNDRDDDMVQSRGAKSVRLHPNYNHEADDADIALMELDVPVTLNSRVQPVCLPTARSTQLNIVDGKKGVVIAWGRDDYDEYSKTLLQDVVPVVGSKKCERGYKKVASRVNITKNMFCAGDGKTNRKYCHDNYGGLMVFADDSKKQRKWILEGILSKQSPSGCKETDQFDVFMLVHSFSSWISKEINN